MFDTSELEDRLLVQRGRDRRVPRRGQKSWPDKRAHWGAKPGGADRNTGRRDGEGRVGVPAIFPPYPGTGPMTGVDRPAPPPDFEGPLPGPRPQLPWDRMQLGQVTGQRNTPYRR